MKSFQALASGGGRFLAVEEEGDDSFQALREMLGPHGDVVHSAEAAALKVQDWLNNATASLSDASTRAAAAREYVVSEHSYSKRASSVLDFAATLRDTKRATPLVVVLYSREKCNSDFEWLHGALPVRREALKVSQ